MKQLKRVNESLGEVKLKEIWVPILLIFILIILEIVLFLIFKNDEIVLYIIIPIISTLITTSFIYILWDIIGRKKFLNNIFNLFDISDNLTESGIEYYYSTFEDIDWIKILEQSKHIEIFFTYGNNFIKKTNELITSKSKAKKLEIDVYFPNFNDSVILKELNKRFEITEDTDVTKQKILDSMKFFRDIEANVHIYKKNITSSYYIIDDEIGIISFFAHKNDKYANVPAIQTRKEGQLFKFIRTEIDSIKENLEKIE